MPGLIRGVARTAVIAGTATAVSNRVSRRQARRWGAEEQQSYEEAPPPEPEPEPEPAPAPEPDPITQLKQFAELKDQGIITEEEFAAQKAKILG